MPDQGEVEKKIQAHQDAWGDWIPPPNKPRPLEKQKVPANKGKLELRDGLDCSLCGEYMDPKDRSIDHVFPLSKGGSKALSNLKLAHKECNTLKGDISEEEDLIKALFLANRRMRERVVNQALQITQFHRANGSPKEMQRKIQSLEDRLAGCYPWVNVPRHTRKGLTKRSKPEQRSDFLDGIIAEMCKMFT